MDKRFIASAQGLAWIVNSPANAGPVDMGIQPTGTISLVAHGSRYYACCRVEGGMAVAISEDGLQWHAPRPPAFGKDRAMALPGVGSGSVFADPKEPAYPFKAVFAIRDAGPWPIDPAKAGDVKSSGLTRAVERGGLYLFRAKDGLQWELAPGLALPFLLDTQNQVFYDARLDRYAVYARAFPTRSGPNRYKRCVARTETADLYTMPWPHRPNPENKPPGAHDYPYVDDEMPIVMAADEQDPPMTDLYNPAVQAYPWAESVYVAFPSMFRGYRHDGRRTSRGRDRRGHWPNGGLFEVQLAVSRDGVNFTRHRTPYVRSGLIRDREGFEGELNCALITMGIGMIRRGDEIWQYYYGTRRVHGAPSDMEQRGMSGGAVFRVVQRLDGFVSVDADSGGGELTTPPIVFAGNRLALNADCGGLGEIWVELQDRDGKPIPGYTLEDAVSIDRNGTAQEIWWTKGPDIGQLAGRPVVMRIKMRSAKLYAFQFSERTGE